MAIPFLLGLVVAAHYALCSSTFFDPNHRGTGCSIIPGRIVVTSRRENVRAYADTAFSRSLDYFFPAESFLCRFRVQPNDCFMESESNASAACGDSPLTARNT
jgi:hypothetical protein